MTAYHKLNHLLLILLICASCFSSFSVNANEDKKTAANSKIPAPLYIGVFPRRNATTTVKFFSPLARYLSEQLGRPVKIKTARDFPTYWKNVLDGKYDIVHYNQYHYIKSRELKQFQVIAQNEEFGQKTLSATIMVRKDSGINSLKDLKGRTIIFGGGKKAMISYVIPSALLKRAGLKKGEYNIKFSKNLPNAMLSVYYKQTDAVGIGNIVMKLPSVKSSVDISQIKTLTTSEPVPHLPWAVKNDMSSNLRDRIQKLLLALNESEEGKTILKKANLTGIHKASDKDYEIHRKYLKEVFGNKY